LLNLFNKRKEFNVVDSLVQGIGSAYQCR